MNTEALDNQFMQRALALAQLAQEKGEVPVGAVLVKAGEIIAEGFNQPIGLQDPTAHAEIVALRAAGKKLGNYRLVGTTLYVTLEPCAMCVGALIHARVQRLVFGAYDPRAGAIKSIFQLPAHPQLNHRLQYQGGLLETSCANILKSFFQSRR